MSFILDALKKSENERQQQGGPELASVPVSDGRPRNPGWVWLVGVLLLINLAVLLGILMRPDDGPARTSNQAPLPVPAPAPQPASQDDTAESTFTEQVAAARKPQPAAPPTAPVSALDTPAVSPPASNAVPRSLPTIDQLKLDGTLEMPELHVDIHVYSDVPAERFVFVNMAKHREGSRLVEGPMVREITPDGAVLEYRGRSFLLPRE